MNVTKELEETGKEVVMVSLEVLSPHLAWGIENNISQYGWLVSRLRIKLGTLSTLGMNANPLIMTFRKWIAMCHCGRQNDQRPVSFLYSIIFNLLVTIWLRTVIMPMNNFQITIKINTEHDSTSYCQILGDCWGDNLEQKV